MLSNTHAYIAEKVYKHLKKCNGLIIDRRFFKYGSITPDYVPRLINIGHYEKDSLNFVQDEIKYLSSLPYSNNRSFLRHYSMRLGIVIHYLSDFFCYAHNNEFLEKDMIKHFMYEARLGHTIRKFEKNMNITEDRLMPVLYIRGITDYMNIKLDSYKHTKASYFNDIKCAMEASYAACFFIINASLANAGSPAA